MKRSKFGDPRPIGENEIMAALDEKLMDPAECEAELRYEEHSDGFDSVGWCAEIRDEEGTSVDTRAYTNKDDLIRDLMACDIPEWMDAE